MPTNPPPRRTNRRTRSRPSSPSALAWPEPLPPGWISTSNLSKLAVANFFRGDERDVKSFVAPASTTSPAPRHRASRPCRSRSPREFAGLLFFVSSAAAVFNVSIHESTLTRAMDKANEPGRFSLRRHRIIPGKA